MVLVAPSDTEESSVLAEIAEYDKLGQAEFQAEFNFGKSSKFRLVHDGRFDDSKANHRGGALYRDLRFMDDGTLVRRCRPEWCGSHP